MKKLYVLLVVFVALWCSLASAAPRRARAVKSVRSDVIPLSRDNFGQMVNNGSDWLIEFFAPWCPHCKKLAPTWEKVATELLMDEVKVAKVDCTTNSDVCGHFDVQIYPTIKFFAKDEKQLFHFPPTEPRTLDAFIDFALGGYASDAGISLPTSYRR